MSDKKALSAGSRTGAASKAAASALKKNQPPKPDKPEDTRSHEQIKTDVAKNRDNLAQTLDAIEFKLNIPKRAKYETAQLKSKLETLREENPAALVAGIAGVAALLGTGIFFGVRSAIRR
ncbi:hypothetical protein B7R21_00655 [Subtercola boreus]|uniref:DUF3618 domain-containing protein n=1 Tax=Subtercola boreus TaxID=120213 RepID=A0A3E0W5J8_9MICO|nr:DUF3618 domain-containing protein [Subtercola boreus]RFA17280.1 hypothetical protein B7R21_00655 [Subtercola boreus]